MSTTPFATAASALNSTQNANTTHHSNSSSSSAGLNAASASLFNSANSSAQIQQLLAQANAQNANGAYIHTAPISAQSTCSPVLSFKPKNFQNSSSNQSGSAKTRIESSSFAKDSQTQLKSNKALDKSTIKARKPRQQYIVVENLERRNSETRNLNDSRKNESAHSAAVLETLDSSSTTSQANHQTNSSVNTSHRVSPSNRDERGVSFCDTISSSKGSGRGGSSANSIILDDCGSSDAGISSHEDEFERGAHCSNAMDEEDFDYKIKWFFDRVEQQELEESNKSVTSIPAYTEGDLSIDNGQKGMGTD